MDKIAYFRELTEYMANTYKSKNRDYGDSFGASVDKYGLISALTRISDKFNRLESLILNGNNEVKDESLQDTLLDLACYSLMTIIELDKKKEPPKEDREDYIRKLEEELKILRNDIALLKTDNDALIKERINLEFKE